MRGRFAWCSCNFGVLHLARPEEVEVDAHARLARRLARRRRWLLGRAARGGGGEPRQLGHPRGARSRVEVLQRVEKRALLALLARRVERHLRARARA